MDAEDDAEDDVEDDEDDVEEVRGKRRKSGKRKGFPKRLRPDDRDGGTVAQPGNPMPYWHPDCRRNGRRLALREMGDVKWTRKEKLNMMRTGGLQGILGLMAAGYGGDRWNETVQSWATSLKSSAVMHPLYDEGEISILALVERCSLAVKKGLVASFSTMVSYSQLFIKALQYVFFFVPCPSVLRCLVAPVLLIFCSFILL